jgi:hypothetical protein
VNDLQALVDAADDAALLRAVDGLCATREWDHLVDLARRCREAVELGKQLWSVAEHIDYRLALEAPPPYAGAVLHPGAGRFALGPLTEVAASRHSWAALSPHIADLASAATVAQERVVRGEDLSGVDVPAELPLRLAPFEPEYPLPVYRDREARFDSPPVATRAMPPARPLVSSPSAPGSRGQGDSGLGARADPIRDRGAPGGGGRGDQPGSAADKTARALRDTVEHWATQSSGTVAAVAVRGDAHDAVAALADEASLVEITPGDALAWLQWAAASGGAHGRRRGGASGRFAAWWAAASRARMPWPEAPDEAFVAELGAALHELAWFRWAPPGPEAGWNLRLAVADAAEGLAWAVNASDQRDEDVEAP